MFEVVSPLFNCRSWIAVAPAFDDFSSAHQVENVRAFLLEPLSCIVLHRGTWHFGPFPSGEDPLRVLNLQGRRYEEDNAHVDMERVAGTPVARLSFEQQLAKVLATARPADNPLAGWFLIISGLVFGLIALVVLAVYLPIYLRLH